MHESISAAPRPTGARSTRTGGRILLAAMLAWLSSCDSETDASGNGYGNEQDFDGYGKLKTLKMVVNVRNLHDTTAGFVVLDRFVQASVMIDHQEFRLASPVVLDNSGVEFSAPDSSRAASPTNYYVEIPILQKLDSISTGASYHEYLVGNLDLGQHVYAVRSLQATTRDGKTVSVRIDTAGYFELAQGDRTKFLGLFTGRVP